MVRHEELDLRSSVVQMHCAPNDDILHAQASCLCTLCSWLIRGNTIIVHQLHRATTAFIIQNFLAVMTDYTKDRVTKGNHCLKVC